MSEFVKITLVRSPIGKHPKHQKTLRALGLRRMNAVKRHKASPEVNGMIRQVSYLLKVEED